MANLRGLSNYFESLPDELLLRICGQLIPEDIIFIFANLDKRMRKIALDELLWREKSRLHGLYYLKTFAACLEDFALHYEEYKKVGGKRRRNSARLAMQVRLHSIVVEGDLELLQKMHAKHTLTKEDFLLRVIMYSAEEKLRTGRSQVMRDYCYQTFFANPDDPSVNLYYAVALNQSVDEINKLIVQGADFNIEDEFNYTAFHLAINYGRLAILDHLLMTYPELINQNTGRLSPVGLAMKWGDADVRKYFYNYFQKMNDIDSQLNFFIAALMLEDGDAVLDMLQKHASQVFIKSVAREVEENKMFELGYKFAGLIVRNENIRVAYYKAMHRTVSSLTLLDALILDSACEDNLDLAGEILTTSLENKGENEILEDAHLLLLWAVKFCKEALLKMLLAFGAKSYEQSFNRAMRAPDSEGKNVFQHFNTPHNSVFFNEIVHSLLLFQEKPLHVVFSERFFSEKHESIRALVEAGADINELDADGKTVLEKAIKDLDAKSVHYFLQQGARIPARAIGSANSLFYQVLEKEAEIKDTSRRRLSFEKKGRKISPMLLGKVQDPHKRACLMLVAEYYSQRYLNKKKYYSNRLGGFFNPIFAYPRKEKLAAVRELINALWEDRDLGVIDKQYQGALCQGELGKIYQFCLNKGGNELRKVGRADKAEVIASALSYK